MKKKFIVGALLTASLLGCGTFTSCKDNNEDFKIEVTQQYNSLKSTLEKLQAQLALLAGCPEKCQEKIDALTKLMQEKDQALQDAIDKKANQSDVDNLGTKLDNEIAKLRNEIKALSDQIASLYLLKSTFENFKTDTETKFQNILQRLEALEGKTGCQCPSVEELTEMFKEIFALKSDFDALSANVAGLQGQIDAINETLKGLPGFEDLDKIDQKIEALKTEFGTQIGGITGSINDIKGDINNINTTIGGINTEILKIWAEIADLGTIRTAIKDLQDAVKQITALQNEIERLEKLINENKTAISGLDGKIGALDTKIGDLDTKLQQQIKEIYEKITNEILGVDAKIEVINGRLTVIEGKFSQIDQNTTDIATNKDNIATNKEAIDKINAQLPLITGSISKLEEWFDGIGITPKEFQEYVLQGKFVKDNKEALESLVKLINDGTINGEALKALNEVYKNLSGINDMYTSIFEGAQAPEEGWWKYDEVIKNIKANSAAIAALQADQEKLLGRLNDMVTSLILQATHNRVFGGVNTPFGFNSMVLMALYGERTTGLDYFPLSGRGAECNNDENDDIDWSSLTSDKVNLGRIICETDANNQANLGTLWFTVNPGTVNNINKNGFAIVNSVEDSVVTLSNITKDDDTVLKFGVTSRAAGNGNGLYRADVTVNTDEFYKIKVNIEEGLTTALKNAVKNHTGSDMMKLAKELFYQLQNVCDANALRYSYDAYTDKKADGSWNKTKQKVYSNYGLAATAFKPLSFATLKGSSFSQRVPTISPITISKDLVDLDLGTFPINQENFKINLKFGEPHFDDLGHLEVKTTVTLYDKDGHPVTGDVTIDITEQADKIQENIKLAMDEWLNTGGTLDYRIDKAIWQALFNGTTEPNPKYPYDDSLPKGVIVDLKKQVDDMTGNIQDKLYDLIDKINKDYLGKVNTLIDKYNTVADHINNVLANPNHYLQVTMLYKKAGKFAITNKVPEVELPFGLLSTNPKQPTQFRGAGEAIRLWATTYNFEVLCPAFKKIVAVTKVTDQNGKERKDLKDAANATLAKVMNGDKQQVALNVAGATNGTYTYELAYQAVDYSGFTSTVKCYIQVIR